MDIEASSAAIVYSLIKLPLITRCNIESTPQQPSFEDP